ncbi:unnamed protein product [Spodoptera exigua]|nr:unnamed protein product [Spodoptera exigua]
MGRTPWCTQKATDGGDPSRPACVKPVYLWLDICEQRALAAPSATGDGAAAPPNSISPPKLVRGSGNFLNVPAQNKLCSELGRRRGQTTDKTDERDSRPERDGTSRSSPAPRAAPASPPPAVQLEDGPES